MEHKTHEKREERQTLEYSHQNLSQLPNVSEFSSKEINLSYNSIRIVKDLDNLGDNINRLILGMTRRSLTVLQIITKFTASSFVETSRLLNILTFHSMN